MASAESVISGHGSTSSDANSIGARAGFRHSLDLTKQQGLDFSYLKEAGSENSGMLKSPTQVIAPKLQSSFSSNDIHAANKSVGAANAASASTNAHAQQHFHNHNASIGRIPPGAMSKHTRELSNDGHIAGMPQSSTYPS
ncbi:hypothetical protein I5L01_15375, partial [Erythrobacter sp. YJ-T3-07]|nr:hypothetical protein [Erythrobacter sp. YJ-T3-07]